MGCMTRLASLIAPAPVCAGCGSRGRALCELCTRRLEDPPPEALAGAGRVVAGFAYEGGARNLVLALKLRAQRGAAGPLTAAMARKAQRHGLAARVLTWVPGGAADMRIRGFDHAEVLAHDLGLRLGLPTVALLTRTSEVADQTGLGAAARELNLRGAFAASRCAGAVALVDDVVTSGATARACAAALRAGGAASLEIVAACRAEASGSTRGTALSN